MAIVEEDDTAEGSMAMVVGDDAVEGYGSFLTLNSIESKHSGNMFSLEDVNWAESCLIKDVELSETWTSLMDALTEAFSSHPDTLASSTAEIDALSPAIDFKISSESLEKPVRTVYDIVPNLTNEELEKNSDKHLTDETTDFFGSRAENRNGFIPTYKEDLSEVDNFDADFDSSFPAFVMVPTTEDIFKVWDLEIPTEEDEITKQLKTLSGGTSKSAPSDFDDSGVSKESTEESVDDLIAGILNLSLDDFISGISDLSLSGKSD